MYDLRHRLSPDWLWYANSNNACTSQGVPLMDRKYFHERFGGQVRVGDIAPSVLLVADPLLPERLAKQFDQATRLADHYEFQVYRGMWHDAPVAVCSTGIGGGSASIAVDELARLGARTLLYLGIAQSHAPDTAAHTLAIAAGAIRLDGASLDYAEPAYPAGAHPEMTLALLTMAQALGHTPQLSLFFSHAGPSASPSALVDSRFSDPPPLPYPIVLASPEVATILTLAGLYRLRAGAVQIQLTGQKAHTWEQKLMPLGLRTLQLLTTWDAEKARHGWSLMTPGLMERIE